MARAILEYKKRERERAAEVAAAASRLLQQQVKERRRSKMGASAQSRSPKGGVNDRSVNGGRQSSWEW